MRQVLVTLVFATLAFSCNSSGKKEPVSNDSATVGPADTALEKPTSDSPRGSDTTKPKMAKDTSTTPMPGSDRDKHGCIASAGYTWSVLRNECIRIWEAGTKLKPTDAVADKTTNAFVVFDNAGFKAEVYIPGQPGSVILEYGKKNSEIWYNDDWHLEKTEKGLFLKKDITILYAE